MVPEFELFKDTRGEFRLRLKASNGQIIATGEGYKTKASALKDTDSVKRSAAGAAIDDLTS